MTSEQKENVPSVDPVAEPSPPDDAGAPPSLVGRLVGDRYRIERLIGEGGMGAVYEAQHLHMRKRVAVKVLHPEMSRLPEIVARFEREAMAAAHIDHPNVATASDFGKLPDGSFFLVLEYIEGRSLREVLTAGPLAVARALHIARQIAEALGRAHGLGIVHRDLKPENVMIVDRGGDPDFAKVLDFGIAKVPIGDLGTGLAPQASGPALTRVGAVFGTPEYMAPEQALGQSVDGRADLYSLGVLLFEMLAGVTPFVHDNPATLLTMHVTTPPPSVASKASSAVPAEIEAIVSRALAKEPDRRFQDAGQLALALASAMGRLVDEGPVASRRGGMAMPASDASTSAATRLASSATHMPVARFVATLEARGREAATLVGASFRRMDTNTRLAAAAGTLGALGLVACTLLLLLASSGNSPVAASTDPMLDGGAPSVQARAAGEQAAIHQDLERAAFARGDVGAAIAEAGRWLDADPSAGRDAQLASDLRGMALGQEAPDAAIALLARMGAVGVDALYDVAYGGTPGPAAARARKALVAPGVAAHASPSLAATLELRAARACDKKKALFDRLAELGDARTLAVLREYEATTGCGFLHARDCWACMHRDDSLAATTAAIEARLHGG